MAKKMPIFDRLDICAAYWLFLSQYHGGQGSREYERLSHLLMHFSPSPRWSKPRDLPENARAIYQDLVVKHHGLHSTYPSALTETCPPIPPHA